MFLTGWRIPWNGLDLGYIIVIAWLAIAVIEVFNALVNHNLPQDLADNVRARRRHTRTHLLRQIGVGLIACSALAAVLMTFPSIRNLGAGLFASAGLAGLVLGMAARRTLGNLIAGIPIALTEPIRIEDAVVDRRRIRPCGGGKYDLCYRPPLGPEPSGRSAVLLHREAISKLDALFFRLDRRGSSVHGLRCQSTSFRKSTGKFWRARRSGIEK
jgi:hypothetical protein